MNYDLVVFDLDGTLLDTSAGIFNSVRYVERGMGFEPISEDELKDFIGPPPKETYKNKYKLSDEDALKATLEHRKYAAEKGIYEAKVYEEIPCVLRTIKNRGCKMAVATLKKQTLADQILRIFSLDVFFDVVVGIDEDETFTKKQTIELAMKSHESPRCLMVGDSEYDYRGSIETGVDFVGALYGFGFTAERLYPFKTISSPIELLGVI